MLLGLSGSSQVQPMYWLNPKNGVQYLVNVFVPQPAMDSVSAIAAIPASASRAGRGDAQLVANLADLRRVNIPPIVNHYNVIPVIDVLAGVNGRDLGGVLRDIRPLIEAAKKELPRGSFINLRGQAQTMNSSYVGLGIGLVMSMALVYLLLVVNFQSWLDPFIIITALPGALAGVVWGLYLTFTTVSVPALMGAIMSLGVATANSVLVVTFARNNLRQGKDVLTAAWEAGVGRLRPVLMTALAMMIGMLPMALGFGEGGEQNAPLGRAVIGGLAVATFATLFLVPAVFTLLHRRAAVKTSEDFDAVLATGPSERKTL
jgi:multidrug efflux pump subunit AcrB